MLIRRGPLTAAVVVVLLLAGCTEPGVAQPAQPAGSPSPSAVPPCGDIPGAGFPPLLTGFDKRLATAPTMPAETADPKDLVTTVLIQGACIAVEPGQMVVMNYVGATLRDGKVFDSTWERGATAEFFVGLIQTGKSAQLIEGIDRGLVGVRIGSRVQLDLPSRMAYGDDAPGGAPSGPLRFIVDVLDSHW
jgi:peptidylprolyl isomerase